MKSWVIGWALADKQIHMYRYNKALRVFKKNNPEFANLNENFGSFIPLWQYHYYKNPYNEAAFIKELNEGIEKGTVY